VSLPSVVLSARPVGNKGRKQGDDDGRGRRTVSRDRLSPGTSSSRE
jgi:hypothetical protein